MGLATTDGMAVLPMQCATRKLERSNRRSHLEVEQ